MSIQSIFRRQRRLAVIVQWNPTIWEVKPGCNFPTVLFQEARQYLPDYRKWFQVRAELVGCEVVVAVPLHAKDPALVFQLEGRMTVGDGCQPAIELVSREPLIAMKKQVSSRSYGVVFI